MSSAYSQSESASQQVGGHSATASHSSDITSPHYSVIKRDGNLAAFDEQKIALAATKAMLAVDDELSSDATSVRQQANLIASQIKTRLHRRFPQGVSINIEDIQDQVELGLMREGLHKVARAYVLYRDEQSRKRTEALAQDNSNEDDAVIGTSYRMLKDDGSEGELFLDDVKRLVAKACAGVEDVNQERLAELAERNLYQGIKEADIHTALIMAARPLIESEPNYTYVTARLLLEALNVEVTRSVGLGASGFAKEQSEASAQQQDYRGIFKASIHKGIKHELLSPKLEQYDLEQLGQALKPERDQLFTYLGLQTLYDRYFIVHEEARIEMPQTFFMRVAMGLALNEDNPNARAVEFYELLSSFDYMSSTPTLFNSGTLRPQLSSCYLTTVPDDLAGIYGALRDNALLSKWAGGLGNDWTSVRSLGAFIKGTNGQSQGVVPFLKVVNDTAVAVNQGGKRKGAVCAYLESWHLDIEDFLDLRKNTGDERRRTHDMNSANWIPDLFMQRVFEEAEWTLFSPNDVPDLHDLYGTAFKARYEHYEALAERGEIKLFKRIPAVELWRKMLSMLFETGHPWITFKDPCNLRSPQQHVGVVHSSNLCTEITLNTSEDEIAVCNLGSINLVNHVDKGELDRQRLEKTVKTAIRMLDNVVDINYYACPQAEHSNLQHRPIGLGLMGFQDALYKLGVPYASIDAVYFADQSSELISYLAIQASSELAKERGAYESFKGSLWDQGILPIDSLDRLKQQRGEQYTLIDNHASLDWNRLREQVKQQGMRNSNVMAIAPTATISNIIGVSQSIEPTYQNLFVKSNLSGEFTVINPWLVKALKAEGLWDAAMVNDLKYFDGSLRDIERIPGALKELFLTAFEIDPHWLVEAAARRQKWLDQAQSLNLYMSEPSGKKLDNLYKTAWTRGLKTTYYLRSLGATHMEKHRHNEAAAGSANASSSDASYQETPHKEAPYKETPYKDHVAQGKTPVSEQEFELGEAPEAPKMCSILEPDCEACQ